MAKVFHGNVDYAVEEFEFSGRLYGGAVVVNYRRHTDGSTITWEPELIRLVDVTEGDMDWEDDDVCSTVSSDSDLGRALLADRKDYIADTCHDDCRWN